MLGHRPGNASAGVARSGPKVLCAQPPLPSRQVSGFRIVLSMAVVWWWRRLRVVLCQSFLVRRLVPKTLREAPSSSLAHRLGLSHLQVRSFNSSCLALQRESVFLQEHLHVCGSCTNKCFLRSEQGPQGFSCLALSFFGLHSHLLCCRKLISPMCWPW